MEPLTDLYEPSLRKIYSYLTSSFQLIQSYFMCFNFLMISNKSKDVIRSRPWSLMGIIMKEKVYMFVFVKHRENI